MSVFERSTVVPCSAAQLFAYHAAPGAFGRLSPPFDDAVVIEPLRELKNGARAVMDVGLLGPVRDRWVALHDDVVFGKGFVDTMVEGPFKAWRHEHIFEALTPTSSRLVDRITYEGPFFGLGNFVVERKLARMFQHRHATTLLDASTLAATTKKLRVGVTGARGLIGTEVRALLSVLGHDVVSFVRAASQQGDGISWDVDSGAVSAEAEALDAVVHLAGENIADGRLDDEKRERLKRGRVEQTAKFFDALQKLKKPPAVVVAASAVGVYGDRGDEVLDEDSASATGAADNFLAELCRGWEQAVIGRAAPWRTVVLRIGIVQSPKGGALQKLLPSFQAGGGAVLGDGTGWTTPVSVDDMADIVHRAIVDDGLAGVVNAVPPSPVTQKTYAETLAQALSRPRLLSVPRGALRLALGEFGDRLLDSARVVPTKLNGRGHRFRHPDLETALRHVTGHAAQQKT